MSMANYDRLKDAAQRGDINLLYTVIRNDPYILEHIDSIPFVETPLHVAAHEGHLEFATEVMRLKPSFSWKLNHDGFSPIHLAMQNDQKSMVFRFVQVDSNLVRVKGREGLTPLHLASQIGEVNLLADLLYACPDSIEDVTVRSETALHIAIKKQNYESLEVLIGMLKKNRERGSMEMENMILNWKDVEDNTILHISALNNDSQAIGLLVKTGINLNAKNLEDKTALDMATNAGINSKLSKAGAKLGSSVTKAPKFADELISKTKFWDKIAVPLLRMGNSISEEQRNAFLVIAALIATATFQAALSPPAGGVFPANAGDNNNVKTTSSKSSTTNSQWKSVFGVIFFSIYTFNSIVSFAVSIITLYILTPSGKLGSILYIPVYSMALCYIFAILMTSPTSGFIITFIWASLYFVLTGGVILAFVSASKSSIQDRIWEIDARKSARVNKW